mgnify:CR=1 FL=1
MTIAKKTAALLTATLLLMVAAVYAAAQLLLIESYNRLEADDGKENVGRVQQALTADRDALTSLAEDWSNWNDAYQFVLDANQEFIDANLHGQAFSKMKTDIVLFINNDGELVNATAFDRHTKERSDPPPGFLNSFGPDSPFLRGDDKLEAISGVLQTEAGLVEFTALPILDSEYKGPSHGTIVFGRKLDSEVIGRISKVVRLPVSMSRVNGDPLGKIEQTALAHLSGGEEAFVAPLSDDDLAGYGLIADVYGKPAALFQVRTPRTIHAQGEQTIRYLPSPRGSKTST